MEVHQLSNDHIKVGLNLNDDQSYNSLDVQKDKYFILLLKVFISHWFFAIDICMSIQQTHRRKVRAWQMICVLSRFVDHDIVGEVARLMHISLYVSKCYFMTSEFNPTTHFHIFFSSNK